MTLSLEDFAIPAVLWSTVVAALVGVPRDVGQSASGVEVRWESPIQVTLKEPVEATFHITNTSGDPIHFDLGEDLVGNFRFELTRPDKSQVVARPISGELVEIMVVGNVLRPGESYSQKVVLNQWLDFNAVGAYTLSINFVGDIHSAGKVQPKVERKKNLGIEVSPYSPARLLATCTLLGSRAGNSGDGHSAVVALATIQDPIAVPFLLKVIGRKFGDSIAIDAIGRIGGQEARDALRALVGGADPEISQYAASVLRRMK